MGCTFIINFLQLITAIGIGKSTATISYFIQYLCLNITSQYSLSERMCALLWNYKEIKTCPQGRSQDLIPLYPLDCDLPLPLPKSLFLTAWQSMACIWLGCSVLADALIASSMCWCLYHKKAGSQGTSLFSPRFCPNFDLNFVLRIDSMIMSLMNYCVRSGLLTWWDLERPRSHIHTNPLKQHSHHWSAYPRKGFPRCLAVFSLALCCD